ncbi:endoplasmic reticulum metallopeptidase 1-like [Ochlerotatus camptorhynchus]|uniref:endoplasmic reticulum metallopeptidase 1-like n=1 Tax=Ochlerotatus camptorhynchus TaxID=644619 RepID=UPI0031D596C9
MEKFSRSHTIPLFWSVLFPAVGIGIYFLVYWNWSTLPEGVRIADESTDKPVFVAERAHEYLRTLTSQGPRVVGSNANEVFAVNFLVEAVNEIIRQADSSNLVTVEVQEASGSYFLDYTDYPITSYYRGVQNVVVTLRKQNANQFSGKYLLLNAHFDSAVTSFGAGDDGTMTVVMLEILRQMSRHNLGLKHGVIFLFNGCEENTMQGAHGFVTGHSLAANVSAFINLDVAANGGREIMFQSAPGFPFLMEKYQQFVKRPYANSLAEEVFQLGLVPSFTDYETLSNVGKWPGMDIALASYGYLYHTAYDAFETISPDTLQHIGDNLLPLVMELARSKELYDVERHRDSSATFFDFMHLFKVTYNETITYVINYLVAIVGLVLIVLTIVIMVRMEGAKLTKVLLECGITLIIQTLSIVVGAGLCIAIAAIADAANRSMSWFTSTWILFGLYFIPFIACLTLGPWLYLRFRKLKYLHNQGRILLFLHAQCFIYITLLVTFTVGGMRSAYIFLFPVIFHSLSSIVNMIIKFKLNHWIYVQLIGQIIPVFYFCSLTVTVFAVFIPMTGRGDAATNPDLMMALFSVLMTLLLVSLSIPLMVLLPKIRYFYILLGTAFLVTVILMITPVGFPFREGTSPQRYYIFHQQRNFYFQNGSTRHSLDNYFLYPQDRHTPHYLFDEVPVWGQRAQPIEEYCDQELYCGFPFYINRYHRQRKNSYWMTSLSRPNFPEPVRLQLLAKQDLTSTVRRFRFSIEGPTLMGFYVSPFRGSRLATWTFSDEIPPSGTPWNGQSVHYVNYVQAKSRSLQEFFIDIESSTTLTAEPILLLSIHANYMYHEQYRTEEFQELLNQMPPYAHTVAYPSYLEIREF